jgi:enoyl-CoA hydratase/carnithine racemase
METFDQYRERFSWARLERDDDGILLVTLHTDGDSLRWVTFKGTADAPEVVVTPAHWELGELFRLIGQDLETRAVILTGTGDTFIHAPGASRAEANARGRHSAASWDETSRVAVDMVMNHLNVPVPMIAALNGPAPYHAELAVMCDVVLAPHEGYFSDASHYSTGAVPGDGVAILWTTLLGPNRGRYFLMNAEELSYEEAHRLGVIGELLDPSDVLDRAYELARDYAQNEPSVARYSRFLLTQPLRRAMTENLTFGLAMQGAGTWARPVNSGRA